MRSNFTEVWDEKELSKLKRMLRQMLSDNGFTPHDVCKAFEEFDEARQCQVLDEDRVLDAMEPDLGRGGFVVDYHACELFPERWFDLVLVLRVGRDVAFGDNQALFGLLKRAIWPHGRGARGATPKKTGRPPHDASAG